jgi:hypothetical protein
MARLGQVRFDYLDFRMQATHDRHVFPMLVQADDLDALPALEPGDEILADQAGGSRKYDTTAFGHEQG